MKPIPILAPAIDAEAAPRFVESVRVAPEPIAHRSRVVVELDARVVAALDLLGARLGMTRDEVVTVAIDDKLLAYASGRCSTRR
jgi:hypothetical protein